MNDNGSPAYDTKTPAQENPVAPSGPRQRFSTLDLAYIAVGAALIAICSWISIPMAVPFTLQTFAVFAILLLLGGKRGTMSILTYVLMGAIGLPVFSGFTGGVGVLLGKTGGYILGFIFTGIIFLLLTMNHKGRPASAKSIASAASVTSASPASAASGKNTASAAAAPSASSASSGKSTFSRNGAFLIELLALVLGLLVCYAFGTGWFIYIYMRDTGSVGLMTVLSWCVFPFIVPDLVKMSLAVIVARRLRFVIR